MPRISGVTSAERQYIDKLSDIVREALLCAFGMDTLATMTASSQLSELASSLVRFIGVREACEEDWGQLDKIEVNAIGANLAAALLSVHAEEVMNLIRIEVFVARFRDNVVQVLTDDFSTIPQLANTTVRAMCMLVRPMLADDDHDERRTKLSIVSRRLKEDLQRVTVTT